MSTVAQRLRYARWFRGATPARLDEAAGVPAGTVERIEGLSRASPRDAGALARLATQLEVRAEWLQRGALVAGAAVTVENCPHTIPHRMATVFGRDAVVLAGPEMFTEIVVATCNYQRDTAFLAAVGIARPGTGPIFCAAWAVPEPENPRDPRAVRILIGASDVGHLARDRTMSWQPILSALRERYGLPVAFVAEVIEQDGAPLVNLCAPVTVPSVSILGVGDARRW